MQALKKYVAECIGTFVLVFVACGTAAALGCSAEPNAAYFLTAAAFGLVIVAMAYSIGNISGCHINPAVSIAMLVSGKMSVADFFGYIIAQFAGATLGALALRGLLGPDSGLGTNGLYDGKIVASLLIEIVLRGGHRDRSVAHPGSHSRHPLHRYVREPGALLRSGDLRRRRCAFQPVGLHRRSAGRRCACGAVLQVPGFRKESEIRLQDSKKAR